MYFDNFILVALNFSSSFAFHFVHVGDLEHTLMIFLHEVHLVGVAAVDHVQGFVGLVVFLRVLVVEM